MKCCRGGEKFEPMICWKGYEERSTKSCRSVREPIEGPDYTAVENGEPVAQQVYYAVVEQEACNSKKGELILA